MDLEKFSVFNEPDRVYLDCNATTALALELKDLVPQWLEAWGNPSSIHWAGRKPKALLRESRKKIAELIGAHPLEVIFTSGGSEANNLAIKGVYEAQQLGLYLRNPEFHQRNEYVVSQVEHPSVTKAMDFLEKKGATVHRIPVSRQGELDMAFYDQVLSEKTALVSVMYGNNETGSIFPIKKLVQKAHAVGALFHCDAVQALGKAPVKVTEWGVDFASFSAHKFYALKGAGLLYSKKGNVLESLIHGGAQERGRRAGTENTLAIASFGQMAERVKEVEFRAGKMKILRDLMQDKILQSIDGVSVTAGESKRLPNSLSLVIDGVEGETLLMNLDMQGFSVSTGAACSSGNPEPSPVLLAMGLSHKEAQSSLRLSLSWSTTEKEILDFVQTLKQVTLKLRSFQ